MRNAILISSAASLLFAASVASAQSHDPQDAAHKTGETKGAPMTDNASFDDLDTSKDGYITKNELMGNPAWAQKFSQLDTNGDGKISKEEWENRGK